MQPYGLQTRAPISASGVKEFNVFVTNLMDFLCKNFEGIPFLKLL